MKKMNLFASILVAVGVALGGMGSAIAADHLAPRPAASAPKAVVKAPAKKTVKKTKQVAKQAVVKKA